MDSVSCGNKGLNQFKYMNATFASQKAFDIFKHERLGTLLNDDLSKARY
jgi:hypothetical protein